MAMVLSRCAPWTLHFRGQHLLLGSDPKRATLRLQAIGTNKAALVTKKKKKKKKIDKTPAGSQDYEEEEQDYTDIPNMSDWIQNKPPGFGVDKEYDTSLEEKILEEIGIQNEGLEEKKRNAKRSENSGEKKTTQVTRISLRDGKVVEKNSEKMIKAKQREQEVDGIKVKVTHLPRKKNILKDLRVAYQGASGLLQIKPNELANDKTRDPVCKGSAILTFQKEINVSRFLEKFSNRKLAFGKLEKSPTYELLEAKKKTSTKQPVSKNETVITRAPDVNNVIPKEDEFFPKPEAKDTLSVADEVQESVADTILECEEVDEDGDDESDEDEEELLDENFEAFSRSTVGEIEDEDEYSDEEEDLDSGDWIEVDEDEEDGEEQPKSELAEAGDNTHFVEVDVSVPLTIKDLGAVPEDVIYSSNQRILELDEEISRLEKKLKRKRSSSPQELEQQILKLREEKIELLEKRVLARIVAAREAHRTRRAKKIAAAEDESSKKNRSRLKIDDEKIRDVVSKHFTR